MPRSLGVAAVRRLAIAAMMLWVVAFPATALAQTTTLNPAAGTGHAQDQVVLTGSVVVPKGSTVGEVVVFHGRALISGSVQGDVVVLDGPVTIDGGYVTGDIVTLHGVIHVTSTSLIGGSVLGGGHVVVDPGAKVGGDVREHVSFTLEGPVAALGFVLGSVALAVSVLLVGLLLLFVAPRATERVATAARTAPFASLGWGVLVTIALPVLCVLAIASIVGLPLGLAGLLAIALLFLVGLAFTAWAIGRVVVKPPGRRMPAFLAGWGIVAVAGAIPFVQIGVWGLGGAFGLGAFVVAIWRSRRAEKVGRHRVGGGFEPESSATQ
jgi:hypothetical protein